METITTVFKPARIVPCYSSKDRNFISPRMRSLTGESLRRGSLQISYGHSRQGFYVASGQYKKPFESYNVHTTSGQGLALAPDVSPIISAIHFLMFGGGRDGARLKEMLGHKLILMVGADQAQQLLLAPPTRAERLQVYEGTQNYGMRRDVFGAWWE